MIKKTFNATKFQKNAPVRPIAASTYHVLTHSGYLVSGSAGAAYFQVII